MVTENLFVQDMSSTVSHVELISDQVASGPSALFSDADTNDNASVLMASPIILTAKDGSLSATLAPVSMNLEEAALAPNPGYTQGQPEVSDTSPSFAGSSLIAPLDSAAFSPISFATALLTAVDSPSPMVASPPPSSISPLSLAASPLPAATEATSMIGMDHDNLNEQPVAPSLHPGAEGSDVGGSPAPNIPYTSFCCDAPRNDAMISLPPLSTSIPSPLFLTAEAIDEAIFSPMPEDGLGDSPISLSGGADLTPPPALLMQHPLDEGHYQGALHDADDLMADATPVAAYLGVDMHSPVTFASDRQASTPGTAPSPAPAFFGVPPDSVPHASASPAPVVSSFQGFAAIFPTPVGKSARQVFRPKTNISNHAY